MAPPSPRSKVARPSHILLSARRVPRTAVAVTVTCDASITDGPRASGFMLVSCRFHADRFRGEAALKFQVKWNYMKFHEISTPWTLISWNREGIVKVTLPETRISNPYCFLCGIRRVAGDSSWRRPPAKAKRRFQRTTTKEPRGSSTAARFFGAFSIPWVSKKPNGAFEEPPPKELRGGSFGGWVPSGVFDSEKPNGAFEEPPPEGIGQVWASLSDSFGSLGSFTLWEFDQLYNGADRKNQLKEPISVLWGKRCLAFRPERTRMTDGTKKTGSLVVVLWKRRLA